MLGRADHHTVLQDGRVVADAHRCAVRPYDQALGEYRTGTTAEPATSGWGWSTSSWLKLTAPHRPPGQSAAGRTGPHTTRAQTTRPYALHQVAYWN
jgi:hypothetical protein